MLSHYNYVFDNITSTYNFTTKNDTLYRIAFIVDETFSTISGEEIPNVFQLVIEKTSNELEVYDSKVSRTVSDVIERFFQKVENSLIFVCSDDGKKAEQRHLIFDRWYKNSDFKTSVVKIDNVINITIDELNIHKLYTSFLFRKENPNHEKLLEIYNRIEAILNEPK